MRVALYLRRSTNAELQHDSHEGQEEQLRSFAAAHGDLVVRSYPDDGSGVSAHRDGFRQLIHDVTHQPDFDGILVLDVTRWGRFANVDESAYWEFFCLLHGVRVVYVNEPFRDGNGPYDAMLKTIKRIGAAEYSKDKSRTVQYAKARVVRHGFYPGGSAPYAMTRVMVKPSGEVVQALCPGEHKAIGNYRIKLSPGPPSEVAVVRRIYDEFLAGKNRMAIARGLNDDHVATPHKARWLYGEVHKILRNPVYAGMASVRCRPGQNFPSGERILTPGAWEAVIPLNAWQAVQERLDYLLWRRTPPGLAEQLKIAFERYGPINKQARRALRLPLWETYLRHFRDGTQEALTLAYNNVIARERARIIRALRKDFRVREQDGLVILNDLLRIKISASFPRMHRRGVHWEFRFHDDDPQDVTIGLGFSPPPVVHRLQLFFFHDGRFVQRRRVIYPNLDGKTIANHYRRSLPEIIASIKEHFYRDARAAKTLLLDALAKERVANTGALTRQLGWHASTAYNLYQALRREGHVLPPLKFARRGPVRVTCGDCHQTRLLPLHQALLLKTNYCGRCWQAHRGGWTDVACPLCGMVRRYWTSTLHHLRNGTRTPCINCKESFRVRAHHTRLRNNAARRRALRTISEYLLEDLRARYDDVRLTVRSGLAPILSWREQRKKRQYFRLTVSPRDALTLSKQTTEELALLARRLANRRRWRRTPDRRDDVWTARIR